MRMTAIMAAALLAWPLGHAAAQDATGLWRAARVYAVGLAVAELRPALADCADRSPMQYGRIASCVERVAARASAGVPAGLHGRPETQAAPRAWSEGMLVPPARPALAACAEGGVDAATIGAVADCLDRQTGALGQLLASGRVEALDCMAAHPADLVAALACLQSRP